MNRPVDILLVSADTAGLATLLERLQDACPDWSWRAEGRSGRLPGQPLASAYPHGAFGAADLLLQLHSPEGAPWRLNLHCPAPGRAVAALAAGRCADASLAALRQEHPAVVLDSVDAAIGAGLDGCAERYCRTRAQRVPVLVPDSAAGLERHPALVVEDRPAAFLERCRDPGPNPVRPDHGRLPLILGSLLLALLAAVVLAMLWPQPVAAGVAGDLLRGLRNDSDFSAAPDLSRQATGLLRDRDDTLPAERQRALRDALWAHHLAWSERLLARDDLLAGSDLLQALVGLALAADGDPQRQELLHSRLGRLQELLAQEGGPVGRAHLDAALALAGALAAEPLPAVDTRALQQEAESHLQRVVRSHVVQDLHAALYAHQGPVPDLTALRDRLLDIQAAFGRARVQLPSRFADELQELLAFLAPLPDPATGEVARVEALLRRVWVSGWPTALAEPLGPRIDLRMQLLVEERGVLPEPDRPEQDSQLLSRPLPDGRQLFVARLIQGERSAYRSGFDWSPGQPLRLVCTDENGWWGDIELLRIDSRHRSIG
ncbi:MAG: hypothetical protein ACOCXJ_03390, partial [Planctomycetota bacterium]